MAAARRQSELQIFQDPVPAHDHNHDHDNHNHNHNLNQPHDHDHAHCPTPYSTRYLDSLPSLANPATYTQTHLAPPQPLASQASPNKPCQASSALPSTPLVDKSLNAVKLPPPRHPSCATDALTKKAAHPAMKTQSTGDVHYWTSIASPADKENTHLCHEPLAAPPAALVSSDPPSTKSGSKRQLIDTAPMRDRSKKHKVKDVPSDESDGPLPEPDQMPDVEDDGIKPSFSYAQLIGMAILRAPSRRLTLAQIYKWISDTFVFYRNSQETGWQNSIRHNLSLSKAFSKQERPKDDPGKGHYWVINAGFEKMYYIIKPVRRPAHPESSASSYPSDVPRPSTSMSASFPPLSSTKGFDSSKFPEEPELPSSEATIPCSDMAAHDGHDPLSMPPPRPMPSSPPPVDIHSSPPPPPVSRSRSARQATPPRAPRLPSNSRSGGRRRKFNGLGDSGYYSSIESSAIKGNPLGPLLTSEADIDRPSMKRGRAEEEIARIRGSSYDSPSKTRSYNKEHGHASIISSPFRAPHKTEGPLTPAIVFKRPALPPASASPNTNLRNHRNKMRELVGGSPDKNLAMWVDSSFLDNRNWSPAVAIPNDENVNLVGQGFESTFDIFGDFEYNQSPIKRSAKRPRLERAVTTGGILADITSSKGNVAHSPTPNWKMSSSFLNIPDLSPAKALPPLKPPTLTSTSTVEASLLTPTKEDGPATMAPPRSFHIPAKSQQDDDIFHLLHSDESEPGIDLLQGFEKIGARTSAVAPNGSPQKKTSRLGLARISSSRF